jgi:hypothetical protein
MTMQTVAEAIAEHEDDPTKVVYYSRASRFKMIRRHQTETYNAYGSAINQVPALNYEFMDGLLVVEVGQDMLPDGPRGEEQDAIAWLEAHSAYNIDFWRDGQEPGRLLPTDREVHAEITDALIERDEVKLIALLERERQSHNRKPLTDAARDAIERLRALQGADPAAEETPTGGGEPTVEVFDRVKAIQTLQGLGVEVRPEVTDEQLKAALLVSVPPEQTG